MASLKNVCTNMVGFGGGFRGKFAQICWFYLCSQHADVDKIFGLSVLLDNKDWILNGGSNYFIHIYLKIKYKKTLKQTRYLNL